MNKKFSLFSMTFLISLSLFAQIEVLTGSENGTYYKLAQDMNNYLPAQIMVNGTDSTSVSFLKVLSTSGAIYNFDMLADQKTANKVAIMQLDMLLFKRAEDMIRNTNSTNDLVVLMPLNLEEIHLLVKKSSDIKSLQNLDGKRVGIGTPLEGTYSTAMYIQNQSKILWHNKNLYTHEAMRALLLDQIDAFFMVAAAPIQMLAANAANSPLQMELVPLVNINGWADYYVAETIEEGSYLWQSTAVSTFSVPSVIVVNKAKLTEQEIASLKEWRANVVQNIDQLKANGHPSWKTANPAVFDGTVWPVLE
jgi:TRAP transporter TAXI family solute receptor